MMSKTLKTRDHHGADSLDIIIPVDAVREYDINQGDVFELEAEEQDGDVILRYRRVYES
ncbi:hypothetical protein [Haloquadratum walsbyi]|jgi:hypothetical protein|uniref:SpoVT / AbrB like domain protein n=1 Tax=Haloquadratum walsbyi J07HQW2 TaxID=1238425 RepID=U1MWI0_9EURY|nr:hypothetical protein [Haloquadratum walsbyi]ERG94794.1 MAG: hypothetical protein J07HQW2_01236 [Haloquadratum walsbyi J07HQW2]